MKSAILKLFTVVLTLMIITNSNAQNENEKYKSAALEIVGKSDYCALVTVEKSGLPVVRTMNPFPLNNDFVVWFATNRKSRKVSQIQNNKNVVVYYANHSQAEGYVTINGTATIIDNKELLMSMKREYWNSIPGWQENFVLIKVIPKTVDVVNYSKGVVNEPATMRSPEIIFE